ncbi:MAG: hypothetical protein Kapaf2KO_02230 [Candidatus Kapaibacteriales bacterium]
MLSVSIHAQYHEYNNNDLDSLLSVDINELDNGQLIHHYNVLAASFRSIDKEKALDYISRALELHEEGIINQPQSQTFNIYGNILYDQGLYSSAAEEYSKNLKYVISVNDTGGIGYSYNDLGYIYYKLDDKEKAKSNYLKALDYLRESNFIDPMAHTYSNLMLVCTYNDEIELAEKYLDSSLYYYKQIGFTSEIRRVFSYRGIIYSQLGQTLKADSVFRRTLNEFTYKDYTDSLFLASLYRFVGVNWMTGGEEERSFQYFDTAIYIAKKLNYNDEISKSMLQKALSLVWSGDTLSSIKTIKENIEFAEKNKLINSAIQSYDLLLGLEKYMSESDYLQALKGFVDIKEQYVQEMITEGINTKQSQIEIDLVKEKNKLLAYNSKNDKILLNLALISIFIGLILFFSLIYLYNKQKKLAQQLNDSKSDLENSVLLQKELNDTKDKFFSIIAHDLKNPFGAFKLSLNMMYEDYDSFSEEEKKEYLKELSISSDNLSNLLNELLTWSLSQRGKIEFSPSVNPAETLFDLALSGVLPQATKKGIRISKNGLEERSIYCDPMMFSTIIRNLVSNAVKYSTEGSRVSIYLNNSDTFNIITIKDQGIGMDSQQVKELFKGIRKSSTPGTDNEKGTGLGLVMVKEFVERHEGKIEVESEIGKGTTFHIFLPAKNLKDLPTS